MSWEILVLPSRICPGDENGLVRGFKPHPCFTSAKHSPVSPAPLLGLMAPAETPDAQAESELSWQLWGHGVEEGFGGGDLGETWMC